MSEVKRISVFMHGPNKKVDMVEASHLDSAQSELAALREELAIAKRNEHNSEVAYRAAIEKQDELREDRDKLHAMGLEYSEQVVDLKYDLTAAQQRIADLCGLLVRTLPVVRMVGRLDHLCDYAMAGNIQAEIETTLNPRPTESGASE